MMPPKGKLHSTYIFEWEVNPESAKTPSISLPLTHGNPPPPAQPFSIISAQTSLLKRVKLKPQFWKLQNSFINAQPSLQLHRVQARGKTLHTQTCICSHLRHVCTAEAKTSAAFKHSHNNCIWDNSKHKAACTRCEVQRCAALFPYPLSWVNQKQDCCTETGLTSAWKQKRK